MIPLIQAENLSKRWGSLLLFENISFTINEGQKVALIAKNGTGKSSLLNILAGLDTAEEGKVTLQNGLTIGYFEQVPNLNPENSFIEEVFATENEKLATIKLFEQAVAHNDKDEIGRISEQMDHLNAWDIEVVINQILTQLKITDFDQKVGTLSGGQQKRLSLAKVLINEPEMLILDEPTNHLDLDMIEWLELYLKKSNATLFMVTHDRYFLDRVCNEILEMDNNQIYRYNGNYSYFLEKREERLQLQEIGITKAKNLLKTELEWMRRMPKARGTKAKSRIDSFYDLKDKAEQNFDSKQVQLNINSTRLGKKIIEIEGLTKSFDDIKIVKDFTYKFSRFEKVGLVGKNGTGKTTFLNLVTGQLKADSGKVEIGSTVKFGYYRQDGIQFNPADKVLDAVTKIAEYIFFDDGRKMSASQLLQQFLFPPETQYSFIETLSGGELRRLYLCTVLMENPNFLILDEPTNDLDIITLNVLEEYLKNFAGCVIIVSHDRFFMDKIVDHLFVFEGDAIVSNFPGNYSIYREHVLASTNKPPKPKVTEKPKSQVANTIQKQKLSFKEKQEFEKLEAEIETLSSQKEALEIEINSGDLGHVLLLEKAQELEKIIAELDEKEMRWLELSEYIS